MGTRAGTENLDSGELREGVSSAAPTRVESFTSNAGHFLGSLIVVSIGAA